MSWASSQRCPEFRTGRTETRTALRTVPPVTYRRLPARDRPPGCQRGGIAHRTGVLLRQGQGKGEGRANTRKARLNAARRTTPCTTGPGCHRSGVLNSVQAVQKPGQCWERCPLPAAAGPRQARQTGCQRGGIAHCEGVVLRQGRSEGRTHRWSPPERAPWLSGWRWVLWCGG